MNLDLKTRKGWKTFWERWRYLWWDFKDYFKDVLRDTFSRRRRKPLPAGTYSCKLGHVQFRQSKSGTPTIVLKFKVMGVKGEEVTLICPACAEKKETDGL